MQTVLQQAIETLLQEIDRLTAHRDMYSQEGQQYWMDDAQIKATEGTILYLNTLLPAERETIEQAYLQGAKHPEYSESTHATEYYFDTFTASGDKSKENG